jgi:hypothetical protein
MTLGLAMIRMKGNELILSIYSSTGLFALLLGKMKQKELLFR